MYSISTQMFLLKMAVSERLGVDPKDVEVEWLGENGYNVKVTPKQEIKDIRLDIVFGDKEKRGGGGKVIMSGVRESTLAEEIRDLKDLGVEDHVIKRMMDKYNRMLTDHGDTCNRIREEVYREVRGVKAELAEKETIIRVLTTHIREKELL